MSEQGQRLIKAVREVAARQPDYIFGQACVYVANGAPACLIGHALWEVGLIGPEAENETFNDGGVGDALHELGIDVDDGESLWLENAQNAQDANLPWGEAVKRAEDFSYSFLENW